ncbi:hypothetical protein D3C85_1753760 [compost metagenome]
MITAAAAVSSGATIWQLFTTDFTPLISFIEFATSCLNASSLQIPEIVATPFSTVTCTSGLSLNFALISF